MIFTRDIRRPVILASGSPRRSQILGMMGIAFETALSGVKDEGAYIDAGDLDTSLCRLAAAKARDASERHTGALVLGADTIVVADGKVLGKPADKDDARRMLSLLSGRRHTVVTAVALLCGEVDFSESAAVRTAVFFRTLEEEEIEHYLSFPEYEDKAGAYAVQGGAMTFIDRIEGCYYNVMGLPVTATLGLFKKFARKGDSNG
ncbi:MAG: Maf family protein [Chitinispirillales bacterium]|nr:Maf family protein [Chitinispirillales bacterium]